MRYPWMAARLAAALFLQGWGKAPRVFAAMLCAALTALALSSCGGSDGETSGGDPAAAGGLPVRPAARLEVAPAALMLTARGERQQLRVRAFDADGVEVRADVVWKSSRPEQVMTSAAGLIEAQTALGASQISVEAANGVRSAPVLVSVALPAAGVVLVNDSQVVGTPTLVDPAADDDSDNAYEVVVSGIALPAPGTLMLGREAMTIGGEVIAARADGGAVRVQLRTVPIATLMQTAEIHEVLDFTGLTPEFPAELRAEYDIAKVDGEFVFTPKPGGASQAAPDRVRALKARERKLGPFKCELLTPELPVSLSQPAQFSMKFEPTYQIDFGRDTGLQKLILRADTSFKTKVQLTLNAGGLLNIDCAAPLYTRLMPLPGWAGLVLAGEVKAGLGFELEGNLTIPLLGVELSSETKGPLEMGVDCAAGDCTVVRNYDPVNTNKLRFITPDAANIRTDVFLFGYGFAKLKAGATLLDKLRMDLVTARSGLKLEGSFAPPTSQIAPADSDYRSDYKLALLTEVVAGSQNKAGDSAFRKLLLKLGIFKFNLLKFQTSVPLATSPKGTATRDKETFADGDTLAFTVTLDPATIQFPFVGYNVAKVRIMRSVPGQPAKEVASVAASDGQTRFDLAWVVEGTFGQVEAQFFAFVETRLPTPFDLELGKVGAAPPALAGTFNLATVVNQPFGGLSASGIAFGEAFQRVTRVTGEVEELQNGRLGFAFLKKNASFEFRFEEVRLESATGDCKFLRTDTRVRTLKGTSSVVAEGDGFNLTFFGDNGNSWLLGGSRINVPLSGTDVITRRFTGMTGVCGPNLSDTSRTDAAESGLDGTLINVGFDAGASGRVTIGADGRREIRFDGALPAANGLTGTLTMDLRERPASRATTDVELGLIAPSTAAPGAALTYAVNLTNKSKVAATSLRAEFALPAGYAIVSISGWAGCTTIGTTAVCTAASLAADERRAFLIDVQAPVAGGQYTVKARVASLELDSNFADNHASATTGISD